MKLSDYRPCVGIMLVNRDGLVFVGRRANKQLREHVAPGFEWQDAAGRHRRGRRSLQAALRELRRRPMSLRLSDREARMVRLRPAGRYCEGGLEEPLSRPAARSGLRCAIEGSECEINILYPAGGHRPNSMRGNGSRWRTCRPSSSRSSGRSLRARGCAFAGIGPA